MKRINVEVTHTSVFALTLAGGNPGPVVLDADHLTSGDMQAVASMLRLHTVFVLPGDDEADVFLRYFVPSGEMAMSIHATIAAVTVLVEQRALPPLIRAATGVGVLRIHWVREGAALLVSVEQPGPQFMPAAPSPHAVARALRVAEAAIDTAAGPVQVVSTSRAKLLVPLHDHCVLDQLDPDFDHVWELCERYEATGLYAFTVRARLAELSAESRQFPLRAGFPEDAATGVAASALGAYLIQHETLGPRTPGVSTLAIGQGFAMKRPSAINVAVHVENGDIVLTVVSGSATISGVESISLVTE